VLFGDLVLATGVQWDHDRIDSIVLPVPAGSTGEGRGFEGREFGRLGVMGFAMETAVADRNFNRIVPPPLPV
jgi:hypothetical protein